MAVVENLPSPGAERPIASAAWKRKEDERFIRGQGTYLDDIELPDAARRPAAIRRARRADRLHRHRRRSSTPTSPRS